MKATKLIFKTFFLSLCIIANMHFAYAQSGGIIPNGLNVFLDNNGKPLSSGKVYFYTGAVGSTTPKTTYSDINLTTPNTNPVILDAAGRPNGSKGLFGTGTYYQVVKDKNNNIIWAVITSAAGSGSSGGSTATGDGDLVGTIKPWAGPTAPNQYMFTYGQEVSRTTYSALFAAITSIQNVFCTSGSAILSGIGDTTNFWIGMALEIPCVLSGATTVISKTSNSITMASNANVSTNTTATFFMWGRGNGTTTFNLPDFRGLIPMGNNIMGGVASSNMSDLYFGTQGASSSGGQGGKQSYSIVDANLTAYTPAGTIALNQSTASGTGNFIAATTNINAVGNGASFPAVTGTIGFSPTFTGTAASGRATGSAVSATIGSGGSSYTNGTQILTVSGGTCTVQPQFTVTVAGGVASAPVLANAGFCSSPPSNPAATTGGGGTGATLNITYAILPIPLIPPTKTVNYIIKVTPDANSATANGVTDISGMTGSIACGAGLICTGNTISTLGTGAGGSNTQVQFNNTGALAGSNCFVWVSPTLTIGLNGTCGGQLVLVGATSGSVTQSVQAAAGTPSVVWGTSSGTPAVSAISPLSINSSTGQISLATVPVSLGGTSNSAALGARSSTGLNIDGATSTGDANYTILSTDRMVYHTALSAARTDTLPAANSVNAGQQFIISDFRGVATASNTVTVQRAGGDTINGVASVVAINAQFGAGIFWSDGVSRWTFFPQTTGGGTGTVTQVSCGVGMSGGNITNTGTCDNYLDPNSITDCTVAASVAANALTVALKTRAGNNPSASEPCWVSFRNATAATGDYSVVAVTAATSFSTGTSSSTFGSVNNTPFALWVTLWNNSGTVAIGLSNQTTSSTTFALNENAVASTTACSACTTATAAGTYYTTSALTSKSFRVFAKLEWSSGLVTAGTWASGPTLSILKTMSVPLPGMPIQTATGSTQTQATTTNTTYTTTGVNATLSPTSATNPVVCNYSGSANPFTTSSSIQLAILRGGSVVGFSKTAVNFTGTNGGAFTIASDSARDLPGTTASTTWGVYMNSNNNTRTVGFPLGTSGAADGGGQISCTEIAS